MSKEYIPLTWKLNENNKWYTISEIVNQGLLFGYGRSKIYELIKMGYIRSKKGPGRNAKVFINSKEIDRFVNSLEYDQYFDENPPHPND